MNANELADVLENDYWDSRANKVMLEGAKMLRQQQALIENLNGRIERMIEKQSHYEAMAHAGGFETGRELGMKQERERNNEPVAWFEQDPDMKSVWYQSEQDNPNAIPLYTHSVKELTDKEIANTWDDVRKNATLKSSMKDIQDFARAILRKAQEKC
jgi:hypothetical protein